MFYQDFSYDFSYSSDFFTFDSSYFGSRLSQAAWAKDLVAPRRKAPKNGGFRHGGYPNSWIHWIGLGGNFYPDTPMIFVVKKPWFPVKIFPTKSIWTIYLEMDDLGTPHKWDIRPHFVRVRTFMITCLVEYSEII